MEYRTLGRTGEKVSARSFGASSMGAVFHPIDEVEGVRAVHAAFGGGINYFDVSPLYGLTQAETVFGEALRELPRHSLLLSTKAGRYGMDRFDMSAARLTRSIDESLRRLPTDYVDILLVHDIECVPLAQVAEESIPAVQALKEQGKIRFYGVSGLPLSVFTRVLAHHDLDVVLSYCHYALNDHTLMDVLPELENRGIGVVNASPLGVGLLAERGAPDWHPATADIKDACGRAAEYCRRQGRDRAELAIQYSVHEPRLAITLFSTARAENVRNNRRWAESPPDAELLAEVLKILEPVQGKTWRMPSHSS